MTLENESMLVKQLQKGNHQAFNALYLKYFSKLYGFCYKLTGNKTDSEEIVQEVFIKVWEIKHSLDPDRNFGSMLFTIGKHKIYNKARQRVYNKVYCSYIKNFNAEAEEITAQEISYNETQDFLGKAISLLPEKRKEIFIMSRMEGLSNKEIAEKQNTSISNVENHINKALKSIRDNFIKNEINILFILLYLLS
jgi:RNA polymerase sigma-70 factor, ECF subfamily